MCLANMAGHVDLGLYTEDVSRPLLDGLLHWAVCPAAQGQDAFPTVSSSSGLSPQRLALEALCKLCVTENNVDLVIATPPHSRLERLCAVLTRLLCRSEEQVSFPNILVLLYLVLYTCRITGDIVVDMQPGLQKDRLGSKKLGQQKMFVTKQKFVLQKCHFNLS